MIFNTFVICACLGIVWLVNIKIMCCCLGQGKTDHGAKIFRRTKIKIRIFEADEDNVLVENKHQYKKQVG